MKPRQSYIGIDLGTTNTKAVLTDATGKVIFKIKSGYESIQPKPGYHEQDPEIIWCAFREVFDAALKEVPADAPLMAVGFSAAMHGVIALDHAGKPLTNLITWADTRAASVAEDLRRSGKAFAFYQATGVPVHPMSPFCKIRWIREHQPELFARTTHFVSIKEYIWFRLTGKLEVDWSIASATGLLDLSTRDWNRDALAFAGIGPEHLSKPVSITFTRSVDGHNLVIGASDGALANIGSGATAEAEAALTIGTSGAIRILHSRPVADESQRLFSYVVDQDRFLVGGAINNGGIALDWFTDQFFTGEQHSSDVNQLLSQAAAVPAGSDGLIFLPYIHGERAPVWDAAARGVFFGIHSLHTRAHFLRAVLEGISFSLRQILEAIEEHTGKIRKIHASGGFTASPLWLGIMQDVMQRPLLLTEDADASAMGAIRVAAGAIADGLSEDPARLHEAGGPVQTAGSAVSDAGENNGPYQRNYRIFARLYPALQAEFAMQNASV